jgi:hypothetical protein
MEFGYVQTLYKDALPEGRLPTPEELHAAVRDRNRANPFLLAYLRYRQEYERYLRFVDTVPMESGVLSQAEVQRGNPVIIREAQEVCRQLVALVDSRPDKKKVIRRLSGPGIIFQDAIRLVFVRRFLRVLGKHREG